LGADLDVQTIYGETKKIKVPAGTQSGDKLKLQKEGFYRLNSSDKGNQVITLKVKIPTKLTPKER
jgi:molecular chaperone DnaJ